MARVCGQRSAVFAPAAAQRCWRGPALVFGRRCADCNSLPRKVRAWAWCSVQRAMPLIPRRRHSAYNWLQAAASSSCRFSSAVAAVGRHRFRWIWRIQQTPSVPSPAWRQLRYRACPRRIRPVIDGSRMDLRDSVISRERARNRIATSRLFRRLLRVCAPPAKPVGARVVVLVAAYALGLPALPRLFSAAHVARESCSRPNNHNHRQTSGSSLL